MKKNELLHINDSIYRELARDNGRVLLIDCIYKTMPSWEDASILDNCAPASIQELYDRDGLLPRSESEVCGSDAKTMHLRFSMIAPVLSVVGDENRRSKKIEEASELFEVSKQTIRKYLCLYLAYQNIAVLAPKAKQKKVALSQDQKNMRWALNKYFYSTAKNSLYFTYTMLLREKYCDGDGTLSHEYPSFYQFRYYYRKTKKLQNFLISREGLSQYQRDHRPLTGEGVRDFAHDVGVGMLDSTVCDVYIINDDGSLAGRPVLTVCIDGFSGLCCGYSLSWDNSVDSLRSLMLNVIDDKVRLCQDFGVEMEKWQWDCDQLPSVLVTDRGSEYTSQTFTQITELGVKIITLPPYRPELKGVVEKFFDIIQGMFKPFLKRRGLIDLDFKERGARDYRLDACLTLRDFEKILLLCLVHYNSKRVITPANTREMMYDGVEPHSCALWNWGRTQPGAHLISVQKDTLRLVLLPRTTGTFTRRGIRVNELRYHNPRFQEQYLKGGSVTIAYSPEDASSVWALIGDEYIECSLVDHRFMNEDLDTIRDIKAAERSMVTRAKNSKIQDDIDLTRSIQAVVSSSDFNNKRSERE